jgi:hypothetical protein
MQQWTSPEPLRLPIPFENVKRVDLEFINVRRDTGSFTAFVYVNAGDISTESAGRDHERFAGSFSIFAPTECWGVDDHCDWTKGPVSAFDRRPPHHLSPINVSMEITDAVRGLGDPAELRITIHAARRDDPNAVEGVLHFQRLTALAYQ